VTHPGNAVFLSYASQDAEAAKRVCDALRAAGIEVWFDQSELRGGDAWDQKIRQQVKSCYLFVPIISANTQARKEGYFRREWNLAVARTLDMAEGMAFLLPVVIDDTPDSEALVPEKFREVQWTRLSGGAGSDAFADHVRKLVAPGTTLPSGNGAGSPAPPRSPTGKTSGGLPPSPGHSFMPWATIGVVIVVAGFFLAHRFTAFRPSAPGPQASAMIVPYSAEDRRMTFALLPLQADGSDQTGLKVAAATGNAVFTSLEENHQWVQLASLASVTHALTQSSEPRDLARSLRVHFLFRGNVARSASGYTVTLFVLDGESEHVLGSMAFSVPAGAIVPRSPEGIDDATGMLVYYALENEVARARNTSDAALDVRDLTFRAFVDWGRKRMAGEGKGAYLAATQLLNRALVLAPDDPLALRIVAKINLCDCVEAWSTNIAEQQAVAEKAIDRYLGTHMDDGGALHDKARLYAARGRYSESLLILGSLLERRPEDSSLAEDKAALLLKLGRANEAAVPAAAAYAARDRPDRAALLAAIDYETRDFAGAERLSQKAITAMSNAELRSSNAGTVRLTLIAAAAQLHHEGVVRTAIADLADAVPELKTIDAIRKWMNPQANLYGYEPLFEGLRLAGMHDQDVR